MKWHMTPEEVKEFKDKIIYLDAYFHRLGETRTALDFEFGQLEKYFGAENTSVGIVVNFRKAFFFKLEQVLSSILDLEKEIWISSFDYYVESLKIGASKREESLRRVTSFVDLFLTQYFSLFDLFIKSVCELSNLSISEELDGLGRLYKLAREKKLDEESEKIFKSLLNEEETFTELKNYRDYLVHHGHLVIDRSRKKIDDEYSVDVYNVWQIDKKKAKRYSQSKDSMLKVTYFLRNGLKKQLECFSKVMGTLKELPTESMLGENDGKDGRYT